MPSIQGGGGILPQPIQPQRQVQQAAVQAAPAETSLAPKDTLRVQAAPTQTSQGSATAQRLTSETTRAQIHQLILGAVISPPSEKPQLQMMQKPAMSSALADMLQAHHVPDQAQAQPQQPPPPGGAAQQAQTFAGMQQASTLVRARETEDASDRNTLQSGKRARKQEKEGEFDSLEDFGGEGGNSGHQSGRDDRSDSQKKKQILTQQERRNAPAGAKPAVVPPPKPAPRPAGKPLSPFKAAAAPLGQPKPAGQNHVARLAAPTGQAPKPVSSVGQPPKPPAPKADKPTIQRIQPPLGQQKPPAPPKKPTDEWSF